MRQQLRRLCMELARRATSCTCHLLPTLCPMQTADISAQNLGDEGFAYVVDALSFNDKCAPLLLLLGAAAALLRGVSSSLARVRCLQGVFGGLRLPTAMRTCVPCRHCVCVQLPWRLQVRSGRLLQERSGL